MRYILYTGPGEVQDISVNRTSGTMLIVTWTKLTLEEARGFVTSKILNYRLIID